MTEQPTTSPGQAPGEAEPDVPAPLEEHGHVRTEGETAVDDALGSSEDPV